MSLKYIFPIGPLGKRAKQKNEPRPAKRRRIAEVFSLPQVGSHRLGGFAARGPAPLAARPKPARGLGPRKGCGETDSASEGATDVDPRFHQAQFINRNGFRGE